MKPGDLIEWTYKYNGVVVGEDETMWSSIEKRYCHIGGDMVHLLVHCDKETYSWVNRKGLFRASVDDTELVTAITTAIQVVLHAVQPRP